MLWTPLTSIHWRPLMAAGWTYREMVHNVVLESWVALGRKTHRQHDC